MRIIRRLMRTQQGATDILTNLGLISALLLTMVTINPEDLGSELDETLGAEAVRSIHVLLAVGSFNFFAMCTIGCVLQMIFVSNFADDKNDDDLLKFFEESSMLMKGILASFLIAVACWIGTVVLLFLTLLPFWTRTALAISYLIVLAVYLTSVFLAIRGIYRTLAYRETLANRCRADPVAVGLLNRLRRRRRCGSTSAGTHEARAGSTAGASDKPPVGGHVDDLHVVDTSEDNWCGQTTLSFPWPFFPHASMCMCASMFRPQAIRALCQTRPFTARRTGRRG